MVLSWLLSSSKAVVANLSDLTSWSVDRWLATTDLKGQASKKRSCGIHTAAKASHTFLPPRSHPGQASRWELKAEGESNSLNHKTTVWTWSAYHSHPCSPQLQFFSLFLAMAECSWLIRTLCIVSFPCLGSILQGNVSIYHSLHFLQSECPIKGPFLHAVSPLTLVEIVAFVIAHHTPVLPHINAKSIQVCVSNVHLKATDRITYIYLCIYLYLSLQSALTSMSM